MTDNEIRASYRDAARKDKQIDILCDLTLRPRDEILKVLADAGLREITNNDIEVNTMKNYTRWTTERMGMTEASIHKHFYRRLREGKPVHKPATTVSDTAKTASKGADNVDAPADDTLERMVINIISAARKIGIEPKTVKAVIDGSTTYAEASNGSCGIKLWHTEDGDAQ